MEIYWNKSMQNLGPKDEIYRSIHCSWFMEGSFNEQKYSKMNGAAAWNASWSECVQEEGKWPLVSADDKYISFWMGIWINILKIVYLTLRSHGNDQYTVVGMEGWEELSVQCRSFSQGHFSLHISVLVNMKKRK